MTKAHGTPVEGAVADAVPENWVDLYAPAWSRPYLRLSRADRPIGTWLLLMPCWWAILLAAAATDGLSLWSIWLMLGSAVGAFLMRGAGCTWNDITDREFDARVARTRSRPIPSGQVSVKQAVIWMGLQSSAAFVILLSFPAPAILLGIASLALIAIYPFAKRFTWWPQVFLGLAFNWGALLLWTAETGSLALPAVVLYAAGIAWTLFYDTIYAHQDTKDDALIGVKSTARLFSEDSPKWLSAFLALTVCLFGLAIIFALLPKGNPLQLALALGGAWGLGWHLIWQLRKLDINNPENCMKLFRSNRDAGFLAVLFLGLAALV